MSAAKRWAVGDAVIVSKRSGEVESRISSVGRKWLLVEREHGRFDLNGNHEWDVSRHARTPRDHFAAKVREADESAVYGLRFSGLSWLTSDEVAAIAVIVRTARARGAR